ncbi:hypothetical protein TrCOL_g2169 [Triparma columacea]|uniref:Cilia- and flagella-associated protein 57 n=1 Tax=Triparma columacea TaxID=722753 RepID=A0A9W7GKT6_9STRA|nr:hypothetical protein TrCOL_g2169 [Triparma columacea]
MATENLKFSHIFGLTGAVRNNLHFCEEGVVVYPCGSNTVIYRSDTREMELIPASFGTPFTAEAISCLSVSPNKRFIAVAEKSDRGVVSIYDSSTLRRRKVLNYAELESKEIIHICFSQDNKLCLTQGGAPDYSLVLWNVEKAVKVVASVKLAAPNNAAIYKADFCPADPFVICVTGQGVLRFFRILENSFRPATLSIKREPQDYVCQCWLPEDRVVVATENGELMIIENFEFKCVLSSSPSDGKRVGSIIAYSKGFIVGSAGGTLRIYERTDETREFYKLSKTFTIKTNLECTITNLAVSPSEDTLLCSTDDNQVYTFSLSNTDILKEDSMNFELLMAPFHGPGKSGSSQITGIDTCIWKPLVVTCGLDRTVRVWNYLEKSLELMKEFQEEAHSIALHPSGLYVIVGFTDRLRLCSILMGDIRCVKELSIKSCKECRFSNGGQHFAVVNSTTVQVYGTYTCELVATLRGHNGKVRSLYWRAGDRELATVGMDGSMFVWGVSLGTKEKEEIQPRCSFASGRGTADFARGYVVGTDLTIKEYEMQVGNGKTDMVLRSEVVVDAPLGESCLSGSGKILFAGTSTAKKPGVIKAFKIKQQGLEKGADKLPIHAGPVTCMRTSFDGQYLFTGSEDGSLAIFHIKDVEGKGAKGRDRETGGDFAEEILVYKSDLEEKQAQISALHHKVEELSMNNDYQLRLKDMQYQEKSKEVTNKFTAELEADAARYTQLMEEKKEMESEYEEKMSSLERKHTDEFRELEDGYNGKINVEIQRYETLVSEREEQNRKWDEENQALVDSHTEFLQNLTDDYDRKVESEQTQQASLSDDKDKMEVKFESVKELIEEDSELEVQELKGKYEGKLSAERKATLRLQGENGFMRKKYESMFKEVNDQKEEISSLLDKEKELYESIKGLEKDIQGHKKEIREREETIVDKEKRIYDLKKKNQELEKFKFVLDYKIKELKRQIEPRENEISDMRTMIEEMDLELEQYHKSNSALDLMIGELRLKMDGMNREIAAQKKVIETGDEFIGRFRVDLEECAKRIGSGSGKALKDEVARIYKVYARDDVAKGAEGRGAGGNGGGGKKGKKGKGKGGEGGEAVQTQYNRQREHLERSVESLKRKMAKDVELHNSDNGRLTRENVALTREMNELRREKKDLELQESNMEAQYGGGGGLAGGEPGGRPALGGLTPQPPSAVGRRSKQGSRVGGGSQASSSAKAGGRNVVAMLQVEEEVREQENIIRQLQERVESLKGMRGSGMGPEVVG